MSLTNDNGMVLPVAPMGGYGNSLGGNFGEGMWLWVLLLFAFMGNGNWGNGFGGGGGMDGMYPWLVNNTNQGFDQAATSSALAGIQTSLTNGFSNAEVAACNRAMANMQTAYTNQIASMNQDFANAQALAAQLNGMSAQQAQCCCDNKLLIANLSADIAREACADRTTVNDALRDVITNQTANTQTIVDAVRSINDKLVNQELQAERRENDNLRTQLNMQNLAASQAAQTAAFIADNNSQTQQLIQRIAPYPVPSFNVPSPYYYGGCGMNGYGMV